jgi:hypothetical protein
MTKTDDVVDLEEVRSDAVLIRDKKLPHEREYPFALGGLVVGAIRLAEEVERTRSSYSVEQAIKVEEENSRLREANEILTTCNAEDAKTIDRLRAKEVRVTSEEFDRMRGENARLREALDQSEEDLRGIAITLRTDFPIEAKVDELADFADGQANIARTALNPEPSEDQPGGA